MFSSILNLSKGPTLEFIHECDLKKNIFLYMYQLSLIQEHYTFLRKTAITNVITSIINY